MFWKSIFWFVIIEWVLRPATTVKCYSCRSEQTDCLTGQCEGHTCYKREYHMEDGESLYEKGCAPNGTVACLSTAPVDGFSARQCRCQEDWCNQ